MNNQNQQQQQQAAQFDRMIAAARAQPPVFRLPGQPPAVRPAVANIFPNGAVGPIDEEQDDEDDDGFDFDAEEGGAGPLKITIQAPTVVQGNNNVCTTDPAAIAERVSAAIAASLNRFGGDRVGGIPMIDGRGMPRRIEVVVDVGTRIEGRGNLVGEREMVERFRGMPGYGGDVRVEQQHALRGQGAPPAVAGNAGGGVRGPGGLVGIGGAGAGAGAGAIGDALMAARRHAFAAGRTHALAAAAGGPRARRVPEVIIKSEPVDEEAASNNKDNNEPHRAAPNNDNLESGNAAPDGAGPRVAMGVGLDNNRAIPNGVNNADVENAIDIASSPVVGNKTPKGTPRTGSKRKSARIAHDDDVASNDGLGINREAQDLAVKRPRRV